MKIKSKRLSVRKRIKRNNGFGLVDAIVSMSLLLGVITYGIYFSSIRLSTVYNSNLTRSINKEIQRDIERLKSDFWCMYFEGSEDCIQEKPNPTCDGGYCFRNGNKLTRSTLEMQESIRGLPLCSDLAIEILNLNSWNVEESPSNSMIQSWKPGPMRSKVFTGQTVTITRELTIKSPLDNQFLDQSIASIDYRVQWEGKNTHWLSIYLAPEAHSWCDQVI
tara:strand:- start:9644 stop:10303 length:660 start_codon:yes stop_codon:yes gene_type:complete